MLICIATVTHELDGAKAELRVHAATMEIAVDADRRLELVEVLVACTRVYRGGLQ